MCNRNHVMTTVKTASVVEQVEAGTEEDIVEDIEVVEPGLRLEDS